MANSVAAGDRALFMKKQRDKELSELAAKKEKIRKDSQVKNISTKFAKTADSIEEQFKSQTVGLKTREEYEATRLVLEKEKRVLAAMAETEQKEREREESDAAIAAAAAAGVSKKAGRKHVNATKLSFAMDDDDDDSSDGDDSSDEDSDASSKKKKRKASDGPALVKKIKLGKDPHVDTSFLPDRDREEKEDRLRRELAEQWMSEQGKIKEEVLEVTYSYWDGSGHRANVRVKKGDTISQFLMTVQKDWKELRTVSVENLIYVKEDLIIPHNYSFYDLIVTKARGKSGPLFHFDVHDDVRVTADARVEKDESHPGKVCERRWFESNKHIFPASRWEVYDPAKKWAKYTIHGK